MNDIFTLVDVFIFGCGFYAIYSAYVLRTEGRIIPTFLLSKQTEPSACKDVDGFSRFIVPKLQLLGGIMILEGAIALINTFLVDIGTLNLVVGIVFFVVLIWYGFQCRKATDTYF